MRTIWTLSSTVGLVAVLATTPASAQQSGNGGPAAAQPQVNDGRSSVFELHPELTQDEFKEFTAQLGSVLRFRQLGDTTTLERGSVELGVQFASPPIDDSKGPWNNVMSRPTDHPLAASMSVPQVVARFGLSDRTDLGVWGGLGPHANYGLVGVDTKIALLKQGPARPVSVSIRPSITSLIWPSEVWVGTASVDLTVSRAFGRVSPYVGVAASTSLAVERSEHVALDPATAERSLAYAGLSYRWRALAVSGEVEKAAKVSYAFRIGTRF